MGVRAQTAMIIDDDPDLGLLMMSALEKRNIHCMTVYSLPEAAEYLTYMKPTIVFLDNSFPEGLGINFIEEIKSADKEIIVIMMTADTDKWIEEKALEEGAMYFLKKPFSPKTLNKVMDQLNFRKK